MATSVAEFRQDDTFPPVIASTESYAFLEAAAVIDAICVADSVVDATIGALKP